MMQILFFCDRNDFLRLHHKVNDSDIIVNVVTVMRRSCTIETVDTAQMHNCIHAPRAPHTLV